MREMNIFDINGSISKAEWDIAGYPRSFIAGMLNPY
jgi:hypothetical protein